MAENTLLSVNNLSVYYKTRDLGICRAVNEISFDVKEGKTLGLVGETGAGKTTIALSILGLLQSPPGEVVGGEILYKGRNLLKMKPKEMRKGNLYGFSGSNDGVKPGRPDWRTNRRSN